MGVLNGKEKELCTWIFSSFSLQYERKGHSTAEKFVTKGFFTVAAKEGIAWSVKTSINW
jgi:hypothetical protein